MDEILPGLHHWVTAHPNHGLMVSSHYLEPAATVIDPLVPDEGMGGFGAVDHVVLSCRHHDRHHGRFVDEFAAAFHVSEAGVHEYPGEAIEAFAVGDEIVPGITAAATMPIAPDDTALLIDVDGGALLFADSIINTGEGIGFFPDHLLGDDPDRVRRDIAAAVGGLLDRRFDSVLFAHGDPIVGDGRRALGDFVDAYR